MAREVKRGREREDSIRREIEEKKKESIIGEREEKDNKRDEKGEKGKYY